MTREQLKAKFPNASKAFLEKNCDLGLLAYIAKVTDDPELAHHLVPSQLKKRIRQSSKPLLNKLETEFLAVLEKDWPPSCIRPQAKRFKLGNGIWYKPDFTIVTGGKERAYEVKGPHAFRGGFENLKVFAHQWPEVRVILAWKENGEWKSQEVLP